MTVMLAAARVVVSQWSRRKVPRFVTDAVKEPADTEVDPTRGPYASRWHRGPLS